MNFFRSILAEDSEPENSDNYEESDTDPHPNQSPKHQQVETAEDLDSNSNPTSSEDGGGGGGLWSFGDLVKTLTTRSESVLETYRRDLKEFGSGLRKESDLFREVASRAVKELPSSIEVGASAIDGVLKSTADIISQGKDAVLAPSDEEVDASETRNYNDRSSLNSKLYSRFDTQLNAIQRDTRTYSEDPEDLDDYSKWKSGFVLGDKRNEIEKLVGDDGAMHGIYNKVVPDEVDDETFWCRYFYRVHKLKQQEDMRAKLVKRSLSVDDEEELSWDVDDDDDDEHEHDQEKPATSNTKDLPEIEKKEISNDESKTESCNDPDKDKEEYRENAEESKPSGGSVSDDKVELLPKSDEKVDDGNSRDVPTVSAEDEDLEWDEIEDIGSNDEKKVSQGLTPNRAELRKPLTTAEDDDDDLTWDIEDDDEPGKS